MLTKNELEWLSTRRPRTNPCEGCRTESNETCLDCEDRFFYLQDFLPDYRDAAFFNARVNEQLASNTTLIGEACAEVVNNPAAHGFAFEHLKLAHLEAEREMDDENN